MPCGLLDAASRAGVGPVGVTVAPGRGGRGMGVAAVAVGAVGGGALCVAGPGALAVCATALFAAPAGAGAFFATAAFGAIACVAVCAGAPGCAALLAAVFGGAPEIESSAAMGLTPGVVGALPPAVGLAATGFVPVAFVTVAAVAAGWFAVAAGVVVFTTVGAVVVFTGTGAGSAARPTDAVTSRIEQAAPSTNPATVRGSGRFARIVRSFLLVLVRVRGRGRRRRRRRRRRGVQAVRRGGEVDLGGDERIVAAVGLQLHVRNRDDAPQVRELGEERPDLVVAAVHRDLQRHLGVVLLVLRAGRPEGHEVHAGLLGRERDLAQQRRHLAVGRQQLGRERPALVERLVLGLEARQVRDRGARAREFGGLLLVVHLERVDLLALVGEADRNVVREEEQHERDGRQGPAQQDLLGDRALEIQAGHGGLLVGGLVRRHRACDPELDHVAIGDGALLRELQLDVREHRRALEPRDEVGHHEVRERHAFDAQAARAVLAAAVDH